MVALTTRDNINLLKQIHVVVTQRVVINLPDKCSQVLDGKILPMWFVALCSTKQQVNTLENTNNTTNY